MDETGWREAQWAGAKEGLWIVLRMLSYLATFLLGLYVGRR